MKYDGVTLNLVDGATKLNFVVIEYDAATGTLVSECNLCAAFHVTSQQSSQLKCLIASFAESYHAFDEY